MIFYYVRERLVGFNAGLTRRDIETFFGESPFQFMKSKFSVSPTDAYVGQSAHIYFEATGVIQGIEITRPNLFLCYEGNVLGEKALEFAAWLSSGDPSLTEDDLGYMLADGRVSLYVPDKGDHPDVLVKSVYVSVKALPNRLPLSRYAPTEC